MLSTQHARDLGSVHIADAYLRCKASLHFSSMQLMACHLGSPDRLSHDAQVWMIRRAWLRSLAICRILTNEDSIRSISSCFVSAQTGMETTVFPMSG